MDNKTFIEEVYEIAFGDDAINREFSPEEEFSPDGMDDLIPMANITVRKKLGS